MGELRRDSSPQMQLSVDASQKSFCYQRTFEMNPLYLPLMNIFFSCSFKAYFKYDFLALLFQM